MPQPVAAPQPAISGLLRSVNRVSRSLVGVLAAATFGWAASGVRAENLLGYVSLKDERRVAVLSLDVASGAVREIGGLRLPAEPGAMRFAPNGRTLFVALRSSGQIASLKVEPEGGLALNNIAAADSDPAYLATDAEGRFLLSAYYVAGKVAVHPVGEHGLLGEPLQWITTAEKAHAVLLDRSQRYVFVPHTGPNAIYQLLYNVKTGRLEPNANLRLPTPDNSGPRHLVQGARGIYAVNEQGGSVTHFALDLSTGRLRARETISTLPSGFDERNACADLELSEDGRFLYASNRGHDSIAVFAVDPDSGSLERIQIIATEPTPRQFALAPGGRWLVSAGQSSDRLAVFQRDRKSGKLKLHSTVPVGKAPWWIELTRQKTH